MSYFELKYVTDPPNDENVSPETQINANWKDIDRKLHPLTQIPSTFTGITSMPKGLEAFNPNREGAYMYRVAVWNGENWYMTLNHSLIWTPWEEFPLRSPITFRSAQSIPKARVDRTARRIRLTGAVELTGSANFNVNTTYEITSDTAIHADFTPVGGMAVFQGATGLAATGANGFASAVVIVESKTSPSRTAISVRFQGDSGGGNFIMLDGIEWSY